MTIIIRSTGSQAPEGGPFRLDSSEFAVPRREPAGAARP